jgi:putative FmdB family regulatory protein
MPTYEFSCDKCEIIFEHLYMTAPKKTPKSRKCPQCGKLSEKILSAGMFHMRGKQYRLQKSDVTGFYNEAIKDSKNYLANMKSPYKRYQANADWLVETGQIRKVSESEAKSRSAKENKAIENINQIKSRSKKK